VKYASSVVDADEAVSIQLEGRAELLLATVLRYRALVNALDSYFWEPRVARLEDILAQVMVDEARVQEAVSHTQLAAVRKEWSGQLKVLQALQEVQVLQRRLDDLLQLRMPPPRKPMKSRLLELSAVLALRRKVPKSQRGVAGESALAAVAHEMQTVTSFGETLAVFQRHFDVEKCSPLLLLEWQSVRRNWRTGEAALRFCWLKIAQCDPSLGVERDLQALAKGAPRARARRLTEQLVQATFFMNLAQSVMDRVFEARLLGLQVTVPERLAVFDFLLRIEQQDDAVPEILSAPRQALFKLADALSGIPLERGAATHSSAPKQRVANWGSMLQLAQEADQVSVQEKAPLLEFLISSSISSPVRFRRRSPLERSQTGQRVEWNAQKPKPTTLVQALAGGRLRF
jgi:hypothetical protein